MAHVDNLLFVTLASEGFSSTINARTHAAPIDGVDQRFQVGTGTLESNFIDAYTAGTLTVGGASNDTANATAITIGGASIPTTIAGDFTVNGTTFTIAATNLDINDPLVNFNADDTASVDTGVYMTLNGIDDAVMVWDHTASEFVLGRSTDGAGVVGSLTFTEYSRVHFGTLNADGGAANGSGIGDNSILTAQEGAAGFGGGDVVLTGGAAGSGGNLGGGITQTTAAGTVGSSSAGGDGGSIAMTTGNGGNADGAFAGGIGGSVTFDLGDGGDASATATSTAANGGGLTLTGGTGGDTNVTAATIAGIGGSVSFTGGTGGAGANAIGSDAGNGGAVTLTGGVGGVGTGLGLHGTGGAINLNGGAGTLTGGDVNLTTGIGGEGGLGGTVIISNGDAEGSFTDYSPGDIIISNAGASGNAGIAGTISITGGAGGDAVTTVDGSAGGAVTITSGSGGTAFGQTTGNPGAAGDLNLSGGLGGESGTTDLEDGAAGGSVNITGGSGGASNAATDGNGGTGGSISINVGSGGAAQGVGTSVNGVLDIGADVAAASLSFGTAPGTTAISIGVLNAATSITSMQGRWQLPVHGSGDALRIPTEASGGSPTVTGTEGTGDIAWDTTGDQLYIYDGGWVQVGSGAGSSTGTTNLTWTINTDAAAGTNEDACVILKSGDGGTEQPNGELCLVATTGAPYWDMRTDTNGTDVSTRLHIGENGMAAVADLDAFLFFNATDGGATATQSSITWLGAESRMDIAGTDDTVRFSGSGGVQLFTGSGSLHLFDGVSIDFGDTNDAAILWTNATSQLDFDVAGLLQMTATTWDVDTTSTIDINADGAITMATDLGAGAGPAMSFTTATGAAGANNGGALNHTTGNGGAGSASAGGNAGSYLVTSGNGGAGDTTNAAGAGGLVQLSAGNGGVGGTTGDAGAGGAVSILAGTGGTSGTTAAETGGAGGVITITSGNGGAAQAADMNGGTGANVNINAGTGGNGGATSGTDGNGGSVVVTSGTAGSGGNTAGTDGGIQLNSIRDRLILGDDEDTVNTQNISLAWGASTNAITTLGGSEYTLANGYGLGSLFIHVDTTGAAETAALYIRQDDTGTAATDWVKVGQQS